MAPKLSHNHENLLHLQPGSNLGESGVAKPACLEAEGAIQIDSDGPQKAATPKFEVNKTNHLVKVLALRLTEYHYFESFGYRGYVDANCSFEFCFREVPR